MSWPGARGLATMLVVAASALGGCALAPREPLGLIEISERPAERALLSGMRAYDDAQYAVAQGLLTQALGLGLAAPRDRSYAHKYLAFIYCTSDRVAACEAEFRAARVADPRFTLDKAEAGHPQWGPVYQRLRQ